MNKDSNYVIQYDNPIVGKCLIAAKDLEPGDLILQEKPLGMFEMQKKNPCWLNQVVKPTMMFALLMQPFEFRISNLKLNFTDANIIFQCKAQVENLTSFVWVVMKP